jgi:hypothetical protein
MLQSFKAVQRQSLIDVVLNTYGSINLMSKLILDNSITDFNGTTATGDLFAYDDSLVTDQNLYNWIQQYDAKFCTGIVQDIYILTENNFILQSESGQNLMK